MYFDFFFQILDRKSILSSNECLLDKNNNIKTGYENFCIKKGTLKLYPFKDFDFIGKNVVCQKCCQKFASKLSYKAHVGTSICIRTYNGPNLVYLKYKNKNCKRINKKNKNKPVEKQNAHDIKKNLLNPEMLNTLQTRNNCYSDAVLQRNTVKEKQKNGSNKNYDPSVKKPRGRPRKNIEKDTEPGPKKRGRPKKSNSMTVDSSSQNDNSSDNNPENNESELKIERISIVNNAETGKLQYFSSKMKVLTDRFWKLIDTVWTQEKDTNVYQNHIEHHDKIQFIKEEKKKVESSVREKEIIRNIEVLENDLKFLSKQFKDESDYCYTEELELMLSKLNEKRNEYNQSKQKKTEINNGSTTGKGKENIQCIIVNEDESEKIVNKIDFSNSETNGIWVTNDNSTIINPTISIKLNNDCVGVDNLNEELTNEDNLEDNLETSLTEDVTLNCMNSVKNHLNNFDFNHRYGSTLTCTICSRHFESIVEWKMHHYEHLDMMKKKFLCKLCGLKFKMYKNFVKHVNIHVEKERNCTPDNKHSRLFMCKICNRQYNHLVSYFAHIRIHKLK